MSATKGLGGVDPLECKEVIKQILEHLDFWDRTSANSNRDPPEPNPSRPEIGLEDQFYTS